ncbi:hypothetical protein [Corynebacterium sp. LK2510]|uniref:hypothetical protein n=1 Tax=Corynebacterium sp. LK2510 TaxID=3110472 RepID=UPI0034CD9E25
MRHFATAAVAATTAISLVAAPAMAQSSTTDSSIQQEGEAKGGNCYSLSDPFLPDYIEQARDRDQAGEDSVTSSFKVLNRIPTDSEITETFAEMSAMTALSSFCNDAQKGYKVGATLDMVLAAFAIAILGGGIAVHQGLVQLPF